MLAEDHGVKSRVHHGGASVDNSSVVQHSSGTVDRTPTNPASTGGSYVSCSFQGTSSFEEIVMMACRLSGDTSKTLAFRRMLPLSSWQLGEAAQRNSTRLSIKNGFLSVVKGRLINFKFL